MVVRSSRSRWRKIASPFEFGKAVLMDSMAALVLSAERAAR